MRTLLFHFLKGKSEYTRLTDPNQNVKMVDTNLYRQTFYQKNWLSNGRRRITYRGKGGARYVEIKDVASNLLVFEASICKNNPVNVVPLCDEKIEQRDNVHHIILHVCTFVCF